MSSLSLNGSWNKKYPYQLSFISTYKKLMIWQWDEELKIK